MSIYRYHKNSISVCIRVAEGEIERLCETLKEWKCKYNTGYTHPYTDTYGRVWNNPNEPLRLINNLKNKINKLKLAEFGWEARKYRKRQKFEHFIS